MALTKINAKQIDAFGSSTAAQVEVDRHMNMNNKDLVGINDLTASAAKVDNDMVVGGNVEIMGDLTVQGGQLIANVSILEVEDLAIRAARTAPSSSLANGAGLQIGQSGSAFEESILWNHAQQRWDVSAELSASSLRGTIDAAALDLVSTSDLAEGTKLYFTNARSRAAQGVASSGDGSLTYNSTDGVYTYTGPSAAEHQAHFSTGYMIDKSAGEFSIDATEFSASVDDKLDADSASAVRGKISTTTSGDGSIGYVAATGVISYTGPSAAEHQAHFTGGQMISYAAGEFSITNSEFSASVADKLANDDASVVRGKISVNDAGGDGSMAYNTTTGVITYTGPSSSEVHAHLSVVDTNSIDMTVDGGEFKADIQLSGSGLEVSPNGLRIAAGAAGDGLAWNDGVLSSTRSELVAGTVVLNTDSVAFIAADGTEKKESWSDLMDLAAGTGLDTDNDGKLDIQFSGSSLDVNGDNEIFVKQGWVRQRFALTDNSELNHGSMSYNDATGVFAYEGVSQSEIRADFSKADTNSIDMTYSGGQFSADLQLADATSMEIVATGLQLKSSVAGAGISLTGGALALDSVRDRFTDTDLAAGVYQMTQQPAVTAAVQVFLNGQMLDIGVGLDCEVSAGGAITLDTNIALDADDVLIAHYVK
ncbi:MAG TPA: hypothetical protein EYN67_18710 [Flavobacteriales bacterium]|nr:hypothetical protein [Flavobacteriales bacterium]